MKLQLMVGLATLLVVQMACDSAEPPPAVPSETGQRQDAPDVVPVPSGNDADVAEDEPADTVATADTVPTADGDANVEPEPLDLCQWPTGSAATCEPTHAMNLLSPAHLAVSGDGQGGAVIAWASGAELRVAELDADGALVGSVHTQVVEAPISGVAAAPSDEMMMVFYSTGRIGEDASENVILRYRPISPGVGIGEPTILAENFELRGNGLSTIVGPRIRGLTREVKGDKIYDLVALTLLNHDGTVRTTHTVRLEEAFAYYRIHASGSRANYPFVDVTDGAVSYYEQSVYLLACGLPLLPAMVVKQGSKMLATEFWDGVAVWVVRNPEACPEGGGTRVTFHQTGPRISEHVGLGLVPSDLAAVAVRSTDGRGIIVDEQSGVVTMVPFDVGSRSLAEPKFYSVGAEHGEAKSLHPLVAGDDWLVIRVGESLDGSTVLSTWKDCALE